MASASTIPEFAFLFLNAITPAAAPPKNRARPVAFINTMHSRHAPKENPVSDLNRSPRAITGVTATGERHAGSLENCAHSATPPPIAARITHGTARYPRGNGLSLAHGKASQIATAPHVVMV